MLWILQNTDWQTFSTKGQLVSVLGFVSRTVSVAATQLCHYSLQAATDQGRILWLCSKKTLFTEMGSALPLIHRQWFT